MEEWISLREFSRRRSVTLSAVQKAIDSGRVKAVRRSENGRLVAIEHHAATAQWNGNTDLDQAARNGKILGPTEEIAQETNRANGAEEPPVGGSSSSADPDKDPHGYYEARADRERATAKRAELDYLERVGSLVSVTEVREQEFTIFRKLRDNLIAISDRLAPRLAAETDPVRVQHLISEEIRKALHELSRALGIDAAGGPGESQNALQ